ncbi:ABC transporter ATP-binding protein [Pseudonocardia endophytica]|uniref:ATP-binding cassette subfamily C protein n=1 Tax=Pseudonocardia endophytica TaxID=401976 RepID=A0A4R1HXJ4_PSEEN|nr:ABC transporter ATP-binding protein [Pseudonocardia endophytica]TCK26223.1 ATP-binding cassette subfamily C protein [Pseudonocardia endophytica]
MTGLLPTAGSREVRAETRRLLRSRPGLLTGTVVTLVPGTVCGLAGPWVLGAMVDVVVGHRATGELVGLAGVLLGAAVGQALLTGAGSALMARLGQDLTAGVRENVVARALEIPAHEVERAGTGDLVARVSGDVESVNEAVSGVLPTFVEAGLTIALTLAALLLLDWRFALAGLTAVPLQVIALRWYLRTVVPISRAERVAEGARAQQIVETVGGAATVRAYRRSAEHTALVAARSDEARQLSIRLAAVQRRFFGKLNYGELTGLCAIVAVGYWLVGAGAATTGTAAAAALYFHRLFDPFNALLGLFDNAQTAGAAFARLVGVAAIAPRPASGAGSGPVDGRVRVRDVSFRYAPGLPDVLDGIDLDVPDRGRVAVVGTTGAGKTTLATLVAGVHRPGRGTVALGGTDVADLDGTTLRRTCVLLTQDGHVFAGPLSEDLRLAAPDATDDDLERALETAGALSWARTLPDGIRTRVGAGGVAVSPTQAQQIALARVLLADPRIVVLDEATAEAGSAGARVLETACERVLVGRTGLVVAHRLSQAAAADRVVVLEHGRTVESGPPDVLARGHGPFARLWSAWSVHRSP